MQLRSLRSVLHQIGDIRRMLTYVSHPDWPILTACCLRPATPERDDQLGAFLCFLHSLRMLLVQWRVIAPSGLNIRKAPSADSSDVVGKLLASAQSLLSVIECALHCRLASASKDSSTRFRLRIATLRTTCAACAVLVTGDLGSACAWLVRHRVRRHGQSDGAFRTNWHSGGFFRTCPILQFYCALKRWLANARDAQWKVTAAKGVNIRAATALDAQHLGVLPKGQIVYQHARQAIDTPACSPAHCSFCAVAHCGDRNRATGSTTGRAGRQRFATATR